MHRLFSLFAILVVFQISATELPQYIKFNKNGSFQIDGLEFLIQTFSGKWKNLENNKWKNLESKLKPNGLTLTGNMTLEKCFPAVVSESIISTGENTFRLAFKAKFDEPTEVKSLHGLFSIPLDVSEIWVDGKAVALPKECNQRLVYSNANAQEVAFASPVGTKISVRGNPLNFAIQDNRKFNHATFALRFRATPASGEITESSLTLDFKIDPVQTQKVDLTKTANASFVDEVANDGKGGWCDQGPDRDLRMIKPGKVKVGPLSFDILDASQNQGKSIIVLSGEMRKFIASSVSLPLPPNDAKAINLLHASAFTPKAGNQLGTMVARYADGSSERIPVKSVKDCGNWLDPARGENAVIGWSADNSEAPVGLYASSFALQNPGPVALDFEDVSPKVIWMIAGVTLSDRLVHFSAVEERPVEIKENYEWKHLDYNREIHPGSPLDFSFTIDAPAGKYGYVKATPSGTLTFEKAPYQRLRLYGINLVMGASFVPKEAADRLADYLAYCGYNTVRIHHQDAQLVDRNATDSLTLNPAQLDKLDYLFYRMKEKGLYLTTDFYASRKFKPGDNISECDFFDQPQLKMLIPLSRATMENWKEFARRWMNHKNPYTGLTWSEDPALYCINLVNEEMLIYSWNRALQSVRLYEKAFKEYCQTRNLAPTEAINSNPMFRRFLFELQATVLTEQIRFVKEELKMKTLVTSLNCISDIPLTLLRRNFDVIDNHKYHDHPSFPEKAWSLPSKFKQTSSISFLAVLPRVMMSTRLPNKPFMLTEFNFVNPNVFRAEGGPLIGSYAALQDWDALYRFAWSHSADNILKVNGAYGFNMACDPLAQFSDRIAISMFLRGDVTPSKNIYTYTVPSDCIEQNLGSFPSEFTNLGLISAIGSAPQDARDLPANSIMLAPVEAKNPASVKDARIATLWRKANETKVAESATGQLRLDANANSFTVKSSRTESVTLNSGNLVAGTLRVRNASCFQTVAAISLDGKELPQSNSILVFQLTNIANTGLLFGDESKRLVRKTGGRPLLVSKGTATIELETSSPYKTVALNCDGVEYGSVDGVFANCVYSFKADTTLFPGGVMAYHLTH